MNIAIIERNFSAYGNHNAKWVDYNFKLKHAQKFLLDGAKVKAYVFFKGRSILYKEKGEILLLRFAQDLEEEGIVEQLPKLEDKRMIMMLTPKPKKK